MHVCQIRLSPRHGDCRSCGRRVRCPPALAQSAAQWPERPVKMIVPLGAGGPADLVGRYIAQQLGEKFKQSFFIENRPGAAGIIGTAEAAKAAPDGYTILVVASPHINLEVLSHNKPYDLMRDFAPVAVCVLDRRRDGGRQQGARQDREGVHRPRQVASPAS